MRATIDDQGIRSLARDRDVQKQLYYHASRALAVARGSAPRDEGEYIRRMFVRIDSGRVTFGSESYKGWWVEFGSAHNKPHRTLQRAARAVGMRVTNVAIRGSR